MGVDFNYSGLSQIKSDLQCFEKLYQDVLLGSIFPVIRHNTIYFIYHKNILFNYTINKKFQLHKSVLNPPNNKDISNLENSDFLGENTYQTLTGKKFCNDYENIKNSVCNTINENNSNENYYLNFYKKYSYSKKGQKENTRVIDLKMPSENTKYDADKIDLLLFDTTKKILYFAELRNVKSNDLLQPFDKPSIIKKIQTLNSKIGPNIKYMTDYFNKVIKCSNRLFNTKNPTAKKISPQVNILIYNYEINDLGSKATSSNLYKLYREGIEVFASK